MRRTHLNDLSGHVLEMGGWVHLKLPTRFDPQTRCRTVIGWRNPRTTAGELLNPRLWDEASINLEERRLGPMGSPGSTSRSPSRRAAACSSGSGSRSRRFVAGGRPVGPSAVAAAGQARTPAGTKPFVVPRALRVDELPGIAEDYARAVGAGEARQRCDGRCRCPPRSPKIGTRALG